MRLRWSAVLYLFMATATVAQDLPRTASGRPDLQGIWQAEAGAGADLERLLVATGASATNTIPYLPEALARKQANAADRAALDPFESCFLPGTPRIMTLDRPFHIFQNDEHVALTFSWSQVWRLIYTNGESPLYPGIESWMGDSRGRWEDDTLVVEVKDFNDRSWLDAAGNYHSAAMTLVERYRLLDANTIEYEVTITDPAVYSQPWTIRMPLRRQTDMARLLEFQCQAEKEEANGDFERDERTWYPAPIPDENQPFDAAAGATLPLPVAGEDIRRLADGQPDIGGYYMADGGGANYGLEQASDRFLTPTSHGVVVDPADGSLPYQDWARAERVDRALPHRGYDDPTAHCFVAGVPRSHYVPSPFFIMQVPGYVVVLHERMSWRQIPLDGREHLPDDIRLWQGDSIGRWEGDTLVVESSNFNGKAWLNESGDVISHMQTVVETFTPVSADQILYRATVSDPIPYTRPWTIELPFNRAEDELLEVACLEDNNDLHHLKDVRDAYRAAQQQQN